MPALLALLVLLDRQASILMQYMLQNSVREQRFSRRGMVFLIIFAHLSDYLGVVSRAGRERRTTFSRI